MDDRALMEDLLLVTKGVCDLYMHGTIESSTPNILTTFSDSLNDSEIYKTMEQKGWYQSDPADITKIKKAYNKFTTQA
jgi:spore coat protein CotF